MLLLVVISRFALELRFIIVKVLLAVQIYPYSDKWRLLSLSTNTASCNVLITQTYITCVTRRCNAKCSQYFPRYFILHALFLPSYLHLSFFLFLSRSLIHINTFAKRPINIILRNWFLDGARARYMRYIFRASCNRTKLAGWLVSGFRSCAPRSRLDRAFAKASQSEQLSSGASSIFISAEAFKSGGYPPSLLFFAGCTRRRAYPDVARTVNQSLVYELYLAPLGYPR